MKTDTKSYRKTSRIFFLTLIINSAISFSGFAQIAFDDYDSNTKPNSRKIRREAARYNAGDVKDSHLNMDLYSYKRGEAGRQIKSEELETDEIYYAPNPIRKEKHPFFKKKR